MSTTINLAAEISLALTQGCVLRGYTIPPANECVIFLHLTAIKNLWGLKPPCCFMAQKERPTLYDSLDRSRPTGIRREYCR